MKYVLNIILPKNKYLSKIRKKYDSNFDKTKNHITLVYPFSYSNQNKLIEHIKKSINLEPFKLILNGFAKSKKEYYLYMLLTSGRSEIHSLHKKLNSGILSKFKNKDMPRYIPHLTLGKFKSNREIKSALKSLQSDNISISFPINNIRLMKINNNKAKIIRTFKLRRYKIYHLEV